MAEKRKCTPGQHWQGEDEEKSYTVNVGNWFTTPTGASAVLFQGTTDRSASNFSSAASADATISGSLVTTPCLVNLTKGLDYRMELKIQQAGEILECYFIVTGN